MKETQRLALLCVSVAAMIFMPFVAYAFLSSAVYRSSALVRVKAAPGARVQALPPLEASRRLRDAVLDHELIDRLSRDNSPSSVAEAQHLREQFELDTIDGISFTLSFRAPDAARAQQVTNQLARRAVQTAPQALTSSVDEESERRIDDLMGFLAARSAAPAAVAAPSGAPASSAQLREEAMRSGLRAERQRLLDKLQSEPASSSDNPYADTSQPSPDLMKRRVAEIDRLLATPRKSPNAPGAAPEDDDRWKNLVQAVLETSGDKTSSNAAALTAELVQEATLPTSPIEPNRKLVLFTGFLISLGAAGVVVVARSAARGSGRRVRRSSSSRTTKLDDTRRAPHARSHVPMPDRNFGNSTQPITHAPAVVPRDAHAAPEPAPATPDRVVIVPAGIIEIGDRSAPTTARVVQAEVLPAPTSHTTKSAPPPAAAPNEAAQRQTRARGRVTQVLGSPILATGTASAAGPDVAASAPAEAPAADDVRAAATAYASEPARAGYGSEPPRQAPGSDPPAREADGARPAGNARTSSAPPRSGARINPLDVSRTFRPDPALNPAARRALRDDLLPYLRQPGYVVAVLGTEDSAEAKSRVASELSLALAGSEQFRVLLLECDFAAPRLEQLLHLAVPLAAGFSLQLQTRSRESNDYVWSVLHCSRSLDVLAEGAIRAPEAVYNPEFLACVHSLRFQYDAVVLNGPLLSETQACRSLDTVSDGVVTVSRLDHASLVRDMRGVFSPKPFWRAETG